jgi:hypothetical protein
MESRQHKESRHFAQNPSIPDYIQGVISDER